MKQLVALAVAAFLMQSGATQAAAQAPKKGGMLAFAVVAEPPNYDCHANTSFAFVHPIAPHYSTLLKFDGKTYPKLIGDLAKSWTVSADGLTYTFKLAEGVKFHDGSALTSADVKASYERIANPPAGVVSVRKAWYADIDSIATPDAGTIVFKLKAPNASMLVSFASPFDCIYSAAKLKQNPRYPETEIMGSGSLHVRQVREGSIGRANASLATPQGSATSTATRPISSSRTPWCRASWVASSTPSSAAATPPSATSCSPR
jgi:peptide/nickel transport system substrate-binding protein